VAEGLEANQYPIGAPNKSERTHSFQVSRGRFIFLARLNLRFEWRCQNDLRRKHQRGSSTKTVPTATKTVPTATKTVPMADTKTVLTTKNLPKSFALAAFFSHR
jgi:hypothetical protein